MREKIFKKVSTNEVMTSEIIKQYSDFLLQYGEQIDAIGKDLDIFNQSNENIEQRLNQITSEATEYIGDYMLSLLFEADEQDKDESNKFRSADPQDQKKKEDADNLKKARQHILVYYKASSKIFSAKMKTCNQVKKASEKLVKNFIKLQAKGGEKKAEKPTNNTAETTEGTPQIKK